MAILLGIDTGGTFTDAVLVDDSKSGAASVVAKAKALTTKQDLAIGIGNAVRLVLAGCDVDPAKIGLVSLSTTLATNALVEGQGERVALIAIGFEPRDLQRAGLAEAIGSDPVIHLPGGYTAHGIETAPLDIEPLERQLDDLAGAVSGFAVAGYFAVRNPVQEKAVRDFLIERAGLPVTCSHELSAKLNGPKRALTTVLNARLIGMIGRLNAATRTVLEACGIGAPMMVVKGDGALVSAAFAQTRPIETILSGPAASIVGGRHLTGLDNAFVNDIGGTTSDIALLDNGRPRLDPDGPLVGGHRTMVEAVAMHTFGLGGDSQVRLAGDTLKGEIELGPRRLVPISLLACDHPQTVHAALDAQLKSALSSRRDGRFAMRSLSAPDRGLTDRERRLLKVLTAQPVALTTLLSGQAEEAVLDGLVARGLVSISGLTPSDAQHVLNAQSSWDTDAARKALRLFGRVKDRAGKPIGRDPTALARRIVRRVERRSAEIMLQTAFEIDGDEGSLALHPLMARVMDERHREDTPRRRVELALRLDRPVLGLGASAHLYHPGAAEMLGADAVVPDHADVANAVGAVVGQIGVRAAVTVTQPAEGRFHVTGIDTPFRSEDDAFAAAEQEAARQAEKLAAQSGAMSFELELARTVKRATIEGRDMLIEAIFTAIASGRPPIAVQEARDGSTPGNQS